jgi:hypothetical protein
MLPPDKSKNMYQFPKAGFLGHALAPIKPKQTEAF